MGKLAVSPLDMVTIPLLTELYVSELVRRISEP